MSEVSCQPNSTWSQSHQGVTEEIHMWIARRAFFQLVSKGDQQNSVSKNENPAVPGAGRYMHLFVASLTWDSGSKFFNKINTASTSIRSYSGVTYGIYLFVLRLDHRSRPLTRQLSCRRTQLSCRRTQHSCRRTRSRRTRK